MKRAFSNSGQTFSSLELAVSAVGAWNAQTSDSHHWIVNELLPRLDWRQDYFYSVDGHQEFKSWSYYFDNLLNSLGILGDFYAPQLYFENGFPAVRWPRQIGMTIGRHIVESNPDAFNDSSGLVHAKPRGVSADDIFTAAILDSDEIDKPPISVIELACDSLGRFYTLSSGESVPSALSSQYPDRDLIVLPWRVRLSQSELCRSPFDCGAGDFRKGTSTSPLVALINFLRDRAGAMELPIPDWAQSFSGEEMALGLDPKKGGLSGQLEESNPENEVLLQDFLEKISKSGGLSSQQWDFLVETSDIRHAEEYVQAVQLLPERPSPNGQFWSQVYDEILALLRFNKRGRPPGDLVMVACEFPACWCRFVLKDSRVRYCPMHRQSQAAHRSSVARKVRREKERAKSGLSTQRAKWAEQKRKQRLADG